MAVTAMDPTAHPGVAAGTRGPDMPGAVHFEAVRASWDRFRIWDAGHRLWSDGALVVALLLGCLFFPRSDGGDPVVNALLQVGLVLPLLWRRTAPSKVFAVVAGVAFVQWLVTVPLPADLALLVALFTLAVHDTPMRALAGAGVLEIGVVLASVRWTPVGDTALASTVLLSGMVAAALFVGLTLRTWRAYMDALVERANRLELERDQRAELAAAAERSRIAREMHDVVAHNVSIMVALADGARVAAGGDPAGAAEAMGEVSATGRMALADMRSLLGVLRDRDEPTGRTPQPDLARLPALLEGVRATGITVEFAERGTRFAVPPGVGLTVYRLVQESLTNVVKHAPGVSRVRVTLAFDQPTVEVAVRDDGADVGPSSPGHGVRGMRERAAACGGTLRAGPHPGGGWEVVARVRAEGTVVG